MEAKCDLSEEDVSRNDESLFGIKFKLSSEPANKIKQKLGCRQMGCCVWDGAGFVYTFLKLIPHSGGQSSSIRFTSTTCPRPPGLRRKGKRWPFFNK